MTTEITRSNLKLIEADINAALVAISNKYGLESLSTVSGSFSPSSFTLKLQGLVAGCENRDMKVLRAYAPIYGLSEDICNAVVKIQGEDFKVVGMKRKRVAIQRISDNKQFMYNIDSLADIVKAKYPALCA